MSQQVVFRSSREVFTAVDELATLLTDCYPDLQAVLYKGLEFLLAITHRSRGLLVVQSDNDLRPLFTAVINPSLTWTSQLEDPSSPLSSLCREKISPGKIALISKPSLGKCITIPVTFKNIQLGIILIDGSNVNTHERLFLSNVGPLFGHMIQIWRKSPILMERFEQFNSKLNTIVTISDSNFELSEVQLQIAKAVQEIFACHAVVFAFIDFRQGDILLKKILIEHADEWLYQVSLSSKEGIIGEVIQCGKSFLSNYPESQSEYCNAIDGIPGKQLGAILCVPMKIEGKINGVIELINFSDQGFNSQDEHLLLSIVSIIVSVLHNIQQVYELRILSAELEANGWELIRSRDILRSLFDNMPSSVYIVDQDFKLVAVNLARARRAEKEPQELIGLSCYEALFQRNKPCPGCVVGDTLSHKKNTHRKMRIRGDSDELYEWDVQTYPITNEQGRVVQAILVELDITESRRLEDILAQSEKLAAIGQLAAGIAHEINNPLTVILANAQIMQRELPDNPDWMESIDLISRAGTRALQVVRNLLGFARKEEYNLVPTDVNETIQRALDLIQHEILARSVNVTFDPGPDLPLIMASADHLQGVWLNIILNAMDATEPHRGGVVKICTFSQGDEVRVTITDNGEGIRPDRLKRIFEPFYTTKEPGRKSGGTGLGLSVSHRIVKQHGGDIYVDSKAEVGTTFSVAIPAIDLHKKIFRQDEI